MEIRQLMSVERSEDQPGILCFTLLTDDLIGPDRIFAVNMTETFIGQQEVKGLAERTKNGYPLLLAKGEDPRFPGKVRCQPQPSCQ